MEVNAYIDIYILVKAGGWCSKTAMSRICRAFPPEGISNRSKVSRPGKTAHRVCQGHAAAGGAREGFLLIKPINTHLGFALTRCRGRHCVDRLGWRPCTQPRRLPGALLCFSSSSFFRS